MQTSRIWALLLFTLPVSAALAQGGGYLRPVDEPLTVSSAPYHAGDDRQSPPMAAETAPRGGTELMPFRQAEQASFDQPIGDASPAREPLKINPPSDAQRLDRPEAQSPGGALATVLGSLGIVLGVFFAVVWFTRRALPKAAAALPTEAVELLGRTPLSPRQNMHVIRFGGKLLLISATQSGAETLAEIDDPEEVTRITGICKQNQPGSISSTFRQVLSQLANEPAPAGFLGNDEDAEATAAGSRSPQGRRTVRSGDT
jgi:flagellar biogenesis protein FliO